MKIEVRVSIEATGQVGGDTETASHLGAWTSWGVAREPQRAPLLAVKGTAKRYEMEPGAVLGPYVLDTTDLRGDESLYVWLISNTSVADVPSIDKEQRGFAKLNQQSGSVQMPMAKLLGCVAHGTHKGVIKDEELMDSNLVATEIAKERMAGRTPDLARIYDTVRKARATFYVSVVGSSDEALASTTALLMGNQTLGGVTLADSARTRFDMFASVAQATFARTLPVGNTEGGTARLNAGAAKFAADTATNLPAAQANGPVRNPRTGKLLYVPANYRYFIAALDKFVSIYAAQYIGVLDPVSGAIKGPPKFDTKNKALAGLHFAVYRSMIGMLPIIAYWAHAAPDRPYNTPAERDTALKTHAATDATESFYGAMLSASTRRHGMSDERFVQAMTDQYARKDDKVLDEYQVAKSAAVDVGTFIANSGYYTNDSRYRNPERFISEKERAEGQQAADAALAELHKRGESLNVARGTFNPNAAVSLESFDIIVMLFLSISLDCEDSAALASSVARLLAWGRTDRKNGTWDSPALAAAQRMFRDHAILDNGGDVTAAYFGSDGNEMKKNEIKQLPIRGSVEDLRNKTGGHAFGLSVPLARCAVWATRGGFKDTPLHDRVRNMAPWQARQGAMLLEGTGPADHGVLPAAEIFGDSNVLTLKAEAARHLVRDILIDDAWKPLTDAFRPYSTPFYTKRVEPNRRVTGFYRNSVHAGCVELYRLHPGMSQIAFVNPKTSERGLDTMEILRDALRDPSDVGTSGEIVAIDIPFYAHGDAWRREMEPVMEAMVNQLPVTALHNIAKQHVLQPLQVTLMSESALATHLGFTSAEAPVQASLCTHASYQGTLQCYTCGGSGAAAARKKKKQSKKAADEASSSGMRAVAGNAFARIGNVAEAPLATMVPEGLTEKALRGLSPLGAQWADQIGRSSVAGTIEWQRACHGAQIASFVPVPVATAEALTATSVTATIVEYRTDTPLSQGRVEELHAATSWDAFRAGTEKWTRTQLRESAFSVACATLLPNPEGVAVRIALEVDIVKHRAYPAGTLSLVQFSVMGRVFALSPTVAGVSGSLLDTASGRFRESVRVLSPAMFTQAFCTREVMIAEPWIALSDMPHALASPALSALPVMLKFDTGAPSCQPALSPFYDCYTRTDVTLVRFVGRDWAVKKNWAGVTERLRALYAKGMVVAHEFVVSTPLPQGCQMIEMHLLVKV